MALLIRIFLLCLFLAGCASQRILYIPFPTVEDKENWIKAHPDIKLILDSANIIIIEDME